MTDLQTKHHRAAGLINSRKIYICHKPINKAIKIYTHTHRPIWIKTLEKTSSTTSRCVNENLRDIQSRVHDNFSKDGRQNITLRATLRTDRWTNGQSESTMPPATAITDAEAYKYPIQKPSILFTGTSRTANRLGPMRASTFSFIHHRVLCLTILLPLTSLSTELPDPITLRLFYHDKAGWAINWATVSELIASSSKCQSGPRGTH